MTSINQHDLTRQRHDADFITGLRELADWLEDHPNIPAPPYGEDVTVFVHGDTDDQLRANVAQAADRMDTTMIDTGSSFEANRPFPGGVTYRVLGICAQRIAAYEALTSYDGSVTV